MTFIPIGMTASVYPENRKPNVTETVKALVQANVTHRDLRQYFHDTQGKALLPQDVYNLTHKLKLSQSDSEGVEGLLRSIREGGGCTKFGMNECCELEYLFYCTREMKRDLERYSDILVMDATYKSNRYLYPLINVMCVDGEGTGRPVLHGFVRNESCVNVEACLQFLNSVMSEFVNVPSVFFVDKDFSEIAAVREVFPEALIKLCAFHTSTAVKRALTSHGLSSQQVDTFLCDFKEQRDTRSQERFQELQVKIRLEAPDKTVQYFETNWWTKKDMWAAHTSLDVQTLHLTTTNHVESYHSKVKKALHSQTRLTDCIRVLLDYDADLLRTKDIKRQLHSISRFYNVTVTDSTLQSLFNLLTPFASRLVHDQYCLSNKINYSHSLNPSSSISDSDTYSTTGETTTQQNTYSTSLTSCDCSFFLKVILPCRHIFSLRQFLGSPLFSPDIPTNDRFLKTVNPADTVTDGAVMPHETDILPVRRTTVTQEGRYRIASAITSRLNAILQVMGAARFEVMVDRLEKFTQLVAEDKEFDFMLLSDPAAVVDGPSEEPQTDSLPSSPPSTDYLSMEHPMTDSSPSDRLLTESLSIDHTLSNFIPSDPTLTYSQTDGGTMTESLDDQDSPQTDLTSSSRDFTNVKLHMVKPRGRPRNIQNFTRRNKRQCLVSVRTETEASTTDTDLTGDQLFERMCCGCGEIESFEMSVQDDWMECSECAKWYHKKCVNGSVTVRLVIKKFVCRPCMPTLLARMKEEMEGYISTHGLSTS